MKKLFLLFLFGHFCAVTSINAQSAPVYNYTGTQVTTQALLQNAINNIPDNVPGIIVVMNDIALTSVVTVPQRKHPVIVSNEEYRLTISGAYRHFSTESSGNTGNARSLTIGGNLILTRAAGYNGNGGGIELLRDTHTFTLQDNAKITNIYNGYVVHINLGAFYMTGGGINGNTNTYTSLAHGGGVRVLNGSFTMSGGEINGNTSANSGGGVSIESSSFTMNGGIISGNTAAVSGGGVIVQNGSISINGGIISGNRALDAQGGGVFVINTSGTAQFIMRNGEISNNTARNGGGVYSYFSGIPLHILAGTISNNKATQNGGGVYAANYSDMNIGNSVVFTGNKAEEAHNYGEENKGANHTLTAAQTGITGVSGNIQNILWASTSITGTHALNNYDIAYRGGEPFDVALESEIIEITIDKKEIYLISGASSTISATVTGNCIATWHSSDEKVATVNSTGTVTAIKAGTTVITATAGPEEATCFVTVIQSGNSTIEGTVNNSGAGNVRVNLYMGMDGSCRSKKGIIGIRYTLLATTVPNDNGDYRFENLPEGSYMVEATLDGYEPGITDEMTISENETLADVNFTVDDIAEKIIVDNDIISVTTGMVETWHAASLQIYPNPFTDVLHINVETWRAASLRMQVINTAGAIVHTQTIDNPDETIHLGHLPAGLYIIRVENGGSLQTFKVIKIQ